MAGSGTAHLRPEEDVLLRVENLVVEFKVGRRGVVSAVSNISFDVAEGETLGLVGESGCGKSTTGKAIMQLPAPTRGSVRLDGTELTELSGEALRRARPGFQMIFQDPISSLNPRRVVSDIVAEPLNVWRIGSADERRQKVEDVLGTVGIDPAAAASRKPFEFSGGQCQRISIARAVITDPRLIICDEPVSALDVSVQAQILNLLEDLRRDLGLAYVLIAHDLDVVRRLADRVQVMYLGRVVESGTVEQVYAAPRHPYTRALLAARPVADPAAARARGSVALEGDVPSPLDPPPGCRFHPRCPVAQADCARDDPVLAVGADGRGWACHHPLGG